jgi:hypothetical protein
MKKTYSAREVKINGVELGAGEPYLEKGRQLPVPGKTTLRAFQIDAEELQAAMSGVPVDLCAKAAEAMRLEWFRQNERQMAEHFGGLESGGTYSNRARADHVGPELDLEQMLEAQAALIRELCPPSIPIGPDFKLAPFSVKIEGIELRGLDLVVAATVLNRDTGLPLTLQFGAPNPFAVPGHRSYLLKDDLKRIAGNAIRSVLLQLLEHEVDECLRYADGSHVRDPHAGERVMTSPFPPEPRGGER